MSKVDWSKAPEGATHYLEENPGKGWQAMWYMNQGGNWLGIAVSGHPTSWTKDDCEVDDFVPLLIARRSEWNGEGLPPVGTICEFQLSERWSECEILAHYNGKIVAVAKETGAVGYIGQHELRPIRTPEQIAAEEREGSQRDGARHG